MTVKASDAVGVTFINTVLGRGHIGGVVNIQLGVFNFSTDENGDIALDPTVACRLRMDYSCAKHIKESLESLLKEMEDKASPVKITKLNGKSHVVEDSIN